MGSFLLNALKSSGQRIGVLEYEVSYCCHRLNGKYAAHAAQHTACRAQHARWAEWHNNPQVYNYTFIFISLSLSIPLLLSCSMCSPSLSISIFLDIGHTYCNDHNVDQVFMCTMKFRRPYPGLWEGRPLPRALGGSTLIPQISVKL